MTSCWRSIFRAACWPRQSPAGRRSESLQVINLSSSLVQNRPSDRIGIVVFATQAYTLSPLTFDHAWLSRQLDRIEIGVIDADHTASATDSASR